MEKWKDIPGYEGIYEASNLGNIRTCEGKVTSNALYRERHWKQRTLKPKYQKRPCGKYDAKVCLWKDGKEKTYLVARLVAMTWCDGYDPELTVNHIDGDTSNNSCDNLEWTTLADNTRKGFEAGLFPQQHCIVIEHDGSEKHFRSYADASRYLGKSHGYVSGLLKRGKGLQVGDRLVMPS